MTAPEPQRPVDGLAEMIKATLIEFGAETSIHSWRCEWPTVYGGCDCVDELADELALRVRQRRFRLPLIAQAKEEGWL